MNATDVYFELFRDIVPVAGLLGFATGTGFRLFAWMLRQPYGIYRKIVQG